MTPIILKDDNYIICPICGKFCWREVESHEIGGKGCLPKWKIYCDKEVIKKYYFDAPDIIIKQFPPDTWILAYGRNYEEVARNFATQLTILEDSNDLNEIIVEIEPVSAYHVYIDCEYSGKVTFRLTGHIIPRDTWRITEVKE